MAITFVRLQDEAFGAHALLEIDDDAQLAVREHTAAHALDQPVLGLRQRQLAGHPALGDIDDEPVRSRDREDLVLDGGVRVDHQLRLVGRDPEPRPPDFHGSG